MGRIDQTDVRPATEAAWLDFTVAVAGTDDSRLSRMGRHLGDRIPVEGLRADQPKTIGMRLPALRTTPQVGVPVWARVADGGQVPGRRGGAVDRIALSYLWRTHSEADGPDRRVPPDHLHCQDAHHACPACQVFGMVADDRRGTPEPDAASRAHVDSFQLSSIDELDTASVPITPLPAMGAPKPGSGQVYLQLNDGLRPAQLSERPLHEWGSVADKTATGEPSPIRGRKFYWKSTPLSASGSSRERHTRHTNPQGGNDAMLTSAKLVPAGTRFSGSFRFSNLTDAQLGALLVVLNPGLIWGQQAAFGWSVGGGKPLGLGTMMTESINLTTFDAGRYSGLNDGGETARDDADLEAYAKAFLGSAATDLIEASWPAVRNMLTIDHVPGDVIDYPLDVLNDDHAPRRTAAHYLGFAPGFRFWRQTKGHQPNPMVLLPEATDQSLAQQFDGNIISFGEE